MIAALPEAVRAAKTPVEVWHQDEARVGQQGTLTYVWADKGSRPAVLRDQRRQSAYLFGAVCADRGVGAALVLPHANAEVMSLHLAEISRRVAQGAHAVVVLDGAGWHQTGGRLRVPGNVSLLRLPPYSPELNPVENVWQYLRQNQLSNRVFADYERHRRRVLHRLHGHTRPHPVHCSTSLDQNGYYIGRLVSYQPSFALTVFQVALIGRISEASCADAQRCVAAEGADAFPLYEGHSRQNGQSKQRLVSLAALAKPPDPRRDQGLGYSIRRMSTAWKEIRP